MRLKRLNPFLLKPRLTLGIDISGTAVRGVLLNPKKERPVVIRVKEVPIRPAADPHDNPCMDALKALLKEFSLSRVHVSISLPSSLYFISRYDLPHVSAQKIGEAILKQIEEEKLPVPIDEATISYAPLPGAGKGGYIVVCAEKDKISPLFPLLNGAGAVSYYILPSDVSVQKCLDLTRDWNENGAAATFRLGREETVVTFFDGEGFRLRRIIPLGRKDFYHCLVPAGLLPAGKKMDEEEIAEILSRYPLDKVNSGTAAASSDGTAEKVYDALSPVLNRIISSIQKTMHFYETHVGMSKVDTLYLLDDFRGLSNFDGFLRGSLQVKVEHLNAINALEHSEMLSIESLGPSGRACFNTAVGNALEEVGETSLVPREELFLPRLRVLRTFARLTAVILCLCMILLSAFYAHGYSNLEETAGITETVSAKLKGMLQIEGALLQMKEQTLKSRAVLGSLVSTSSQVTEAMKEIGNLLPSFVYLDRMELTSGVESSSLTMNGVIAVEAIEECDKVCSSFLNTLEASPILDNISMQSEKWTKHGDRMISAFCLTADLYSAGGGGVE